MLIIGEYKRTFYETILILTLSPLLIATLQRGIKLSLEIYKLTLTLEWLWPILGHWPHQNLDKVMFKLQK